MRRKIRLGVPLGKPEPVLGRTLALQLLGDQQSQGRAIELADPRDREPIDYLDPLRQLVFGKAVADQELSQFFDGRDGRTRPRHEKRAGLLAEDQIGHRHHLAIGNRRVLHDQLLEFLATELLAAAIDVVTHAPLEAICEFAAEDMRAHQIAGAKEAIRGKRGGIGLG